MKRLYASETAIFFCLEDLEISSGRHTDRRAIAEVLDGLLKLKIEKLHFPNWYQGSRGEPNRLRTRLATGRSQTRDRLRGALEHRRFRSKTCNLLSQRAHRFGCLPH
jgi:hypothetical protein